MRRINELDVTKSLALKRLVFRKKWNYEIDGILLYIVFGSLTILSAFMIINADFNLSNQILLSLTVLPLTICLSLYIIYRKATERLLIELSTSFDKEKNILLLMELAEKNKLVISQKTRDCIMLNTKLYRVTIIFFIKDNLILFTTLKNGFRIDFPTLIYHLIIKNKLNKQYKLATFDV